MSDEWGIREALTALEDGAPGLVVVAHPDDETLGLGGHLARMPGVHLLCLTDGAPREPGFAHAAGFGSPAAYAAERRAELARALALAGVSPERQHRGELFDQDVARSLPAARAVVAGWLEALSPLVVLTHAYEGGHPDHDAAAVAVHAEARATRVLEMPYYHAASGRYATGAFVPASCTEQPTSAAHEVRLDERALAHKRAMLACFRSQRDVLAPFDASVERFRWAPRYDFARPPHPGPLHYERLGWSITGAELCRRAMEEGPWR